MPTIQQLISFLTNNGYIGNSNTITARDIANHFGVSDGAEEVPIRDLIRGAIQHGEIVGSNNTGFYLINNIIELNNNLDSLENRARNILQRRTNLLNNWNALNPTNNTTLPDITL